MMAQRQLLHELLKEDQEPFQLHSYIADRRSQLKKTSPTSALQLKKRRAIAVQETSSKTNNLCNHACFFSFQASPDVRKSPFLDFHSPAMSPCKSSVFLHVPSKTASLLLEAAMRIQKQQQQSKPKSEAKNAGFGLLGSFLKRLKDRSKNKKRAIADCDLKVLKKNEIKSQDKVRISCSRDLEASTSSCGSAECCEEISSDFGLGETRFCSSPFSFTPRISTSSSDRRTPDFCSPAVSPGRRGRQEEEICERRNQDNVQGEEEKEQNSPVSVLDPPFEDDGHESGDADDDEDDYDLDCSYANVQRAKQQLLYRLRRFEKLAELDPMELEKKLLEGSDVEDQSEREESEEDEPSTLYRNQSVDKFVSEILNKSSLQHQSRQMSTDMKRLVSDLIVEEKNEIICSKEVALGRICNRLESWQEVEFDTIDMMIELDFKKESNRWKNLAEELEETAADIEFAIFGVLLEELSGEFVDFHQQNQPCSHVLGSADSTWSLETIN